MVAVGVDMIEIERVRRVLERYGARFRDRVFTPREQAHCGDRPRSLAGRYAGKEAVAKALGTGIGDVGWQEIEILSDGRGKPTLVLHGAALALARRQGWQGWDISLSHTETHAIGFVVATGGRAGGTLTR